ncbi:TnsA-like heteromeric transposase endonuclease subunit [Nocardia cyriacigeorgica]|nr:TnsA-like heteromeric transposase endonuclease subunit [Nocardia cyriacigeorgica]
MPWARVTGNGIVDAAPWRTFRWRMGQTHYSGTYWSATEHDHVIYESRLELSRLMLADFQLSVRRIVAQPFHLRAVVGGVMRRHVPDYLLLTDSGPIVVDVKPRDRLSRPAVASTFEWTRTLVESRGWRYEIACEPEPVVGENLRFLAGFRRDRLFDPDLVHELTVNLPDGVPLSAVCDAVASWPAPLVRSAALHLMWKQHFVIDLSRQLRPSQPLIRRQV